MSAAPTAPTGPTVTLCRDCCCGTARKHPGVDHDAQVEALRDGLADSGRVVVSQCLLACERSNVVVVTPTPAARRAGAKPVWLSRVLFPAETQAVIDWVNAGGPGVVDVPARLLGKVAPRPGFWASDPF